MRTVTPCHVPETVTSDVPLTLFCYIQKERLIVIFCEEMGPQEMGPHEGPDFSVEISILHRNREIVVN